MLRKFFFFLIVFLLTIHIFHPPSTQADYPNDCALDYPICHTSIPPGTPVGTCLNHSVIGCNTSSGVPGVWCCPSSFIFPSLTPTPPSVPTCIANGNYCVATNVACDPGHTRGQGGNCETGKICCAITLPTVPPPGGPPGPIPLPTYPTNFSPLEYPCNTTTDEEFHPLRPYPASPCDPLIPKKQEPDFLSFACGKSLNTLGEYPVSRSFTQAQLDAMSPIFQNYGEPYRCGAQVCIRKRSVFDIALDLSSAKLPIIGNTQDPLDDATKVNNYLSWYLAGTNPTWLEDLNLATPAQNVNSQCIGTSLATFMNTVVSGTTNLRNIRLTSPAFNLTNPAEQDIFIAMSQAGANFADIDAFAGNTYTLNGVAAYDWVISPSFRGADGKTWKEKFTSFNKGIIFTEFGDFATFDNPPGSPNRASVISAMRQEFTNTAGDGVVKSINYFNAFGGNPQFIGHQLSISELQVITSSNYSKSGVNSAQGVNRDFPPRVGSAGLKWSVEIITSPGDETGAIESINAAHRAGVIPIIRPCYGNSCGFADPVVYVDFISRVSQRVTDQSREIWFIAGPNEPAGEHWAAPLCGTAGQPVASIDSFLTYAGPIRKLLPQYSLDTIRYVLATNQGRNVHNYLLDTQGRRISQVPSFIRLYSPTDIWTKLFQRVPLATMEDVVGEVTVGLITSPRSDGSSPQPPDVYVVDPSHPDAMRLTIKDGSDSRLYFPHLKTVSSLVEVLNAISRPKLSQNYRPDERNVTQYINEHQGIDDSTPIQRKSNEGNYTGLTRNTEIREGEPAPTALFGQNDHFEFDQRCELTTTQDAVGDNLFGQTINGRLAYTHDLKFDPVVQPNACLPDFAVCTPGVDVCCDNAVCSNVTLGGIDYGDRCHGGNPNSSSIPTEARVAVFTKTPLIDRFYGDLISNSNSFFRRFVNWYDRSTGGPDTTIRSGSLTFPAKTQVGYTATAPIPPPVSPETAPGNPKAGAGNNTGGAEIYFPRLGSLADYFLGGPTNERLNLQKMFRPKNFGSLIGPGGAGILAACQPYLSNFPGSITVNIQNPKNVFSKVGDSITVSPNFLDAFAGAYNLGSHTGLQSVINFFTPLSFTENTLAAGIGWNTQDLINNNFSALESEYTRTKPAVAIIMIGTNDSGGSNQVVVPVYTDRLERIVNYTVSKGIIPILSTLPHLTNANPQHNTNTELLTGAIKDVSTRLGVPLMDYRLATEQINTAARNWGISTDNIHPSVGGGNAGDLSDLPMSEGGYNVRNFVSLCALDAVWKTRLGGDSSSSGDCFTAAQPVTASCSAPGSTPLNYACHTNLELKSIIQESANKFGVNPSVLLGILSVETRNGIFGITSGEVRRHSTSTSQTGFTPYICQPNSCGAMGAMQLLTGIGVQPSCSQAYGINNWALYGSAVVEACKAPSGYGPNPGNIRDSIYAGAKMIGSFGQNSNSEAGVKEIGRRYFGNDTSRFDLFVNLDYINDCVPGYTTPSSARSMTYGEYLWEVARVR